MEREREREGRRERGRAKEGGRERGRKDGSKHIHVHQQRLSSMSLPMYSTFLRGIGN